MAPETAAASLSAPSLARFAGIGVVGFLIDGGVLTLLVNGLSLDPYLSRAVSFSLAVTATWYGNRRWVFVPTERAGTEYTRYLSVQIAGALLNLSIYVAAIELVPALAIWPVIPLAIGAAAALGFNFILSRAFVFSFRPRRVPVASGVYEGTGNLDAMEHAVNYNGHLLGLLRRHARPGTMLDFGAGTGTFARITASDAPALIAVEPDAALRQGLASAGLHCVPDLSDIADRSIDFAYTFNVLEHIEDDSAALAELRRCLKPDGRLLVYVPAFEVLYSAMDAKVGHFRRYRKQGLVSQLERSGFDVRVARYADCLGFLATLVYKLIGDSTGKLEPRAVEVYDRWVFPLSRFFDRVLGTLFGKNLLVVADLVRHD